MKKKITITAEDNIGRTESITMKSSEYAVERLKKADMQDTLKTELARLYDDYKMGYKTSSVIKRIWNVSVRQKRKMVVLLALLLISTSNKENTQETNGKKYFPSRTSAR